MRFKNPKVRLDESDKGKAGNSLKAHLNERDELPDRKLVRDHVKGKAPKKDTSVLASKLDLTKRKNKAVKDLAAKTAAKKALKKGAKKVGKKLLSSIPLIGGIASAIASKDASAAIPIIGDIASMDGPKKGTPGHDIENPDISRKARRAAIDKLKKKKD